MAVALPAEMEMSTRVGVEVPSSACGGAYLREMQEFSKALGGPLKSTRMLFDAMESAGGGGGAPVDGLEDAVKNLLVKVKE